MTQRLTLSGKVVEVVKDFVTTTYRVADSKDGKRKAGDAFPIGILIVRPADEPVRRD